jgi:hypothetical protein
MRNALLVLSLSYCAACTTLRPVQLDTLAAPTPAVVLGDRLRVTKNDGSTVNLKTTALTPTTIEGTNTHGEHVTIGTAEVDELAVRRRATGKTAALVASLIFGLGSVVDGVKQLPPY